jgi:hypothetical protein
VARVDRAGKAAVIAAGHAARHQRSHGHEPSLKFLRIRESVRFGLGLKQSVCADLSATARIYLHLGLPMRFENQPVQFIPHGHIALCFCCLAYRMAAFTVALAKA